MDPWDDVARRCSCDARLIIGSAIARARVAGNEYPSGCSNAAFDALATLYGALMAQNARLSAEVEALQAKRGAWWRMRCWLTGRGRQEKRR
jgi:outer membrane murein-binding lipoprotein Lpp